MGIKIVSVDVVDETFLEGVFSNPTPLKDKQRIDEKGHPLFLKSDVYNAVEWLKGVIKPLSYIKIDRYRVIEAIEQAFPDLKTSPNKDFTAHSDSSKP